MIAIDVETWRLRVAVVMTAVLALFVLEARSSPGAAEPLGPSSRRTGMVISEIMYHPAARADNRILEFVELYNSNPFFEQIDGYRLSGQIDFTFPSNSMVPGHGFVVVARAAGDIAAVYGISGVLSYAHTNYSTNVVSGLTTVVTNIASLANGDLLNLLDRQGAVLLSVPYSNKRPWPIAADGTGHSLVLARPSYGEGNPMAWSASDVKGGSPGGPESAAFEPLRGVVINEFLANLTAPVQQFIELYNGGTQQVDLTGAYLSDSASTNKFRIPGVTRIAPGGFAAFQRSSLGFSFSGVSGALFLVNSNNSRVIDAVAYDGQTNGLSTGRVPDGGAELFALASPTAGARNSGSYNAEVVINEIMYDPPSGSADDEFIELYNRTSTTVSLQDWALTGGIDFNFPANAVILPNSYLAVCRNVTNLAARYPRTLNCTNAVGNYLGKLGNSGDRVALTKPVQVITTNSSGQFKTNSGAFVVDEVTYGVGGRWGGSGWSQGGGSSLELIDARANRRLASSWGDSEPSTNSIWSSVRIGSTPINGDADLLQILLTGEGECLVDNVEVATSDGPNLTVNSTFELGLDGWIAQGNHIRSTLETNLGYQSSQSLHLRASGPGDTIANYVSTRLNPPLRAGDLATIRARVRWLRGRPNILLRLRGNYLEVRGLPRLAFNQGTPGARNSRALTNGPPQITDLLHAPALPQGSQAVTVTARVEDPDGVSSVLLKYRVDPATSYSSVTMADDGAAPDLVAGDGIYTGTIPGQPAGTLVAFYVEATDGFNPPAKSTFPNDAPARECLVRFGDPVSANDFGSYRFWITQSNLNRWINQPAAGLEPVDGTFIYGDRRIIYNVLGSYAAESLPPSYDSPLGTPCDYAFRFPADDPLLGTTDFNKIQAPGSIPGDDTTLQRGQTAAWMAQQEGVRAGYRRYVNFFFNGARRGTLLEDAQIPGADVIDEWFDGDTDGTLFALQPWIELTDSGGVTNYRWCTLNKFVDSEEQETEQLYRWNWTPRVTKDSLASFTSLFALIETADFGFLSDVADTAGWTRLFALQHAVGNRNSFGDLNSYNGFAWLPDHGFWELLPGEFNTVLGAAGSDGPTGDDLLQHISSDGALDGLYSEPVSVRSYWRAIRDVANGPMASATVGSMLDAKFSAFQATGLSVSSPTAIKSWLADRRTYLLSQLAPFDISFGILGTNQFTTNEDFVVIRGTAPLDVDTITLNGEENAVIWETPTNWAVNLFLEKGSNHFVIQGEQQVQSPPTNSATIDVTYTLDLAPPQGYVVINEIMYHPQVSGGSFLELFNTSSKYSFDLSNWRFQGIDFTFPEGTVLRHGDFLLVVEDRNVFSSIYGAGLPVAGEFGGHLSNNGETITLYIPGPSLSQDVIVDQVHYEPQQPWSPVANGTGSSLQLIDPQQDNSRVSNWSVYAPGIDATNPPVVAPPTPGAPNGTLDSLPPFPLLWLNEIQPQNLNSISDSAGERDPWLELFNPGTNSLVLSNFFLSDNFTNLLSWEFPANAAINPGQLLIVWIDGQPSQGTSIEFHTSFRAAPTNGQIVLSRIVSGRPQILDYLKYSGMVGGQSYGCYPDGQGAAREILLDATPAASNNVPPHIFVNEWMASNVTSLEDPADNDTEDWIELFNATYHAIDLSGWFMTDTLTNKNQWQFPVGARIAGRGFLLIWADGEPEQNNPLLPDFHANFQLSKNGEAIGLYRPDLSRMDSVTFGAQINDVSQGRYPDGSSNIQLLTVPTPRQPNFLAPTYPLPPPIYVVRGGVVTFTVADPTVPPYTLGFDLGPDAPPGATIDPYDGTFRWPVPTNQPPGTYTFTIKICDLRPGHFPSSLVITLVVQLPFLITTITRTNNDISLTWNSVTGQTYRVQFTPDLGKAAWSDATTGSVASDTTVTVTLSGRTNRQEFYRVVE